MVPDPRILKLYATAIALQQMHGLRFAQAFLEDQGISSAQAEMLTRWVEDTYPRPAFPEFEEDFQLAIGLLRGIFSHTFCGLPDEQPMTRH